MRLNLLTHFIMEVNAAIDTGRYQDVSVAEVEDHIERGDLLAWLKLRVEDADLSLFEMPVPPSSPIGLETIVAGRDPSQVDLAKELIEGLQEIYGGYRGQERRKWGVEHSGLCLLVAWGTELIQREYRTQRQGGLGQGEDVSG